jgi:hypothetical protein
MAQRDTSVFRAQSNSLRQKYNSIYRKKILKSKDYEDMEQGNDLEDKIKNSWNEFIEIDLPKITNSVRDNKELWHFHS